MVRHTTASGGVPSALDVQRSRAGGVRSTV